MTQYQPGPEKSPNEQDDEVIATQRRCYEKLPPVLQPISNITNDIKII